MDIVHVDPEDRSLNPEELEDRLHAVDPRVLFVVPRVLKRVIRLDRELRGFFITIPHRKSHVVTRERLLSLARRAELGLGRDEEIPEQVILISRPRADVLARQSASLALVKAWRLLFHTHVHLALESAEARRSLTQAALRERIDALGQTAFDQFRSMLEHDHLLVPPVNDRSVYVEFAAVFLDLHRFAPKVLARYFTGARDWHAVEAVLRRDVDVDALLAASRPKGAPPLELAMALMAPPTVVTERPSLTEAESRNGRRHVRRLAARAGRLAAIGNRARAAISRTRASLLATDAATKQSHRLDALVDLDRLVDRLTDALVLDPNCRRAWRRALERLLEPAAIRPHSPSARILVDLQNVCVNHERGVHQVDLLKWAMSRGRVPLQRRLRHQQHVLLTRHLRKAGERVRGLGLGGSDIGDLERLVEEAIHEAEQRLRAIFRPILEQGLEEVGLVPNSHVQLLARDRVVASLLDKIVSGGYLNLGQVRDVLSQNDLKLPDVNGPRGWWSGDPLLKLNDLATVRLDGVFRRGEIYLRALQRQSSLLFGTKIGRVFVRYLVLPFGGAYMVLEGLHHTVGMIVEKAGGHWPWHGPLYLLILGVWLFGILHSPLVRKITGRSLHHIWHGVRFILVDLSWKLLALPLYRNLLFGPIPRLIGRFVVRPALLTALMMALAFSLGVHGATLRLAGVLTFLGLQAFLLTRIGDKVEEIGTDLAVSGWAAFRQRFLMGLVRFFVDLFANLLQWFDARLLGVDEWLRFRTGESRFTLGIKAASGAIWFFLAYMARVYVNILLEPQINPVKHFPVVTVSHKIILPLTPELLQVFGAPLRPLLGPWIGNSIAGATVFLLPGAFGFLVWEFKENWKLFRANRARHLQRVRVGGHGETMLQLMKPGFHSGTLPKTLRKLARAEARAGRPRLFAKDPGHLREILHHVEEGVYRFVERDLLHPLRSSRRFAGLPLEVGTIVTGANSIRIALECPLIDAPPMLLVFDEQSGHLVASIPEPGFVPYLTENQALALHDALVGFYHRAGVVLVREQIKNLLGDESYDISDRGLLVWPGEGYEVEVVYELRGPGPSIPARITGALPYPLPSLRVDQVLFSRRRVTFESWTRVWEEDRAGRPTEGLVRDFAILPRFRASVGTAGTPTVSLFLPTHESPAEDLDEPTARATPESAP